MDYTKEFRKKIEHLGHRHDNWRVFEDFCEMAALSLVNAFEQNETREKRYLEIVKRYEPDEVKELAAALGDVVGGLEDNECDFLGQAFMLLELGSHWHGQFFTPYPVSRMIAEMTLQGVGETIEKNGIVRINEPACGSGGMLIAATHVMRKSGIDIARTVHFTAVDCSTVCANMAFIQLTLMDTAASVLTGNSLSLEMREVKHTFRYWSEFWNVKLRRREEESQQAEQADQVIEEQPEPVIVMPPGNAAQLTLF
jgi:type I restriction-modification system DNA methylase subunit